MIEKFCKCIKRVFGEPTEARCLAKSQSYRVHVSAKETKAPRNGKSATLSRTISYWCFAPSEAMHELADLKVRSILVTSGTLSPLESYAMELDLQFIHRLENPHIIPDDQIHVRIVGKGVSGKHLSSSYERRQQEDYFVELGNTLVALANVVPAGMLVFFPSYGVMETCIEKWGGPSGSSSKRSQKHNPTSNFFAVRKKAPPRGASRYSFPFTLGKLATSGSASNPWARLLARKSIVVEPRTSADLPDAIAEFHKFLGMEKSKGVALFGVCRGKISEGIDFAGDMCRAVVITGLPFAPSFDPKVKMKREFLDQARSNKSKVSTDGGFGVAQGYQCKPRAETSLSGHEWYTQQAHRAVNQAVGRVIRNKNDYGAVLLLDSRFAFPGNKNGLSKWVQPHILPDEGVGKAIGTLVQFYRQAEKKALERQHDTFVPLQPDEPTTVSKILKYEDEGENLNREGAEITRVAYIMDSGISENGTTDYIPPSRVIRKVDPSNLPGFQDTKTNSSVEAQRHLKDRNVNECVPKLGSPISQVKVQLSANPSHSAARDFFVQVRSEMTPSEQATIKRAVIAMKQYTDPKHRKAFVKAAKDVINIVLTYDDFVESKKKPGLLELFLTLLPNHYSETIQKLSMYKILLKSSFGTILKDSIDDRMERRRCESDSAVLLWELWFRSTFFTGFCHVRRSSQYGSLEKISSNSSLLSFGTRRWPF